MLIGFDQVHTDDIYDVDDCIEIKKVSGLYVNLKKTNKYEVLEFNNGYLPIPYKTIKSYKLSLFWFWFALPTSTSGLWFFISNTFSHFCICLYILEFIIIQNS